MTPEISNGDYVKNSNTLKQVEHIEELLQSVVLNLKAQRGGFYTKAYFDSIVQSLGTGSSYTVNGNVMDLKYAGNTNRPTLDDYSKLITDHNPCTVLVDNNCGRSFSVWDNASFRWFEIDKRNIPFSTLDTIK